MGSWVERGFVIAFGALWVVFAVGVVTAFAIRERRGGYWAGAGWLLFARGVPGALFLLAGLVGNRNFLWAAGATLVATLLLEPVFKRYFGTGSSL
jgi:hypothetical protein